MTILIDKVLLVQLSDIVKNEFRELFPIENMIDINYKRNVNLYEAIVVSILSTFISTQLLSKIIHHMSPYSIRSKKRIVNKYRIDNTFERCYQKSMYRAATVINTQQVMDLSHDHNNSR